MPWVLESRPTVVRRSVLLTDVCLPAHARLAELSARQDHLKAALAGVNSAY